MDWPGEPQAPPFIHTFMPDSAVWEVHFRSGLATPASAAWGTANRAVYIPFTLKFSYTIQRMFWINGSSAGGNHWVGIYGYDGAYIWRGTAAGSGNSVPQYVTPPAPFRLSPGRYYLGYSHDSTTANRVFMSTTGSALNKRVSGIVEATVNLPASTPTFATATTTSLPLCGFTNTSTGF